VAEKADENAVAALEAGEASGGARRGRWRRRSRPWRGKLAHKDSVMTELLSEYVALKTIRDGGVPPVCRETRVRYVLL
jgi:hypothetical protein